MGAFPVLGCVYNLETMKHFSETLKPLFETPKP